MHRAFGRLLLAAGLCLALPACESDNQKVLDDASGDERSSDAARDLLLRDAADLRAAVKALRGAAPTAGWSATGDAAAIATMKTAWKRARRAYQGLGAILDTYLPDSEAALDTRYETAIAEGADLDAFNGEGFVGLHAVERILWADAIPAEVVASESVLDGYRAAAFPATEAEATAFRDGLCARLVADAKELEEALGVLELDAPVVYEGAIGVLEGHLDKVKAAAAGEDASRYAGNTLAELRDGLAASKATHAVFRDWLRTKPGGKAQDAAIQAGFGRVEAAYGAISGDALPPVPAGWSSTDPAAADRETPFGRLFAAVSAESDSSLDASLAHQMDEAKAVLGIEPVEVPSAGGAPAPKGDAD